MSRVAGAGSVGRDSESARPDECSIDLRARIADTYNMNTTKTDTRERCIICDKVATCEPQCGFFTCDEHVGDIAEDGAIERSYPLGRIERTPHLDAALDQARANMRIVDIRQLDVEIALLQMEDKELRER